MTQAPVLVGRDDFLALADRRLAETAAGTGQLLLIAGEAGIGKTRLLGAITRRAQAMNYIVLRATAYPGDVHSFGGLLLDLASDLIPAEHPRISELGHQLSERVRAMSHNDGDAHHRRRLLVQDLVDMVVINWRTVPVLLILEDLHWADALSLDVLGHLATRLSSKPLLVAAAYRTDELAPQVPLRELRARLLSQRLAEEIRLTRLGTDQTATVVSTVLGQPAPDRVVAAIWERSDGIPLHIEEFLAAIEPDALTRQSGTMVLAAAVPETLSDAVLSRVQRLSPAARGVASAAAVIGRSFDFDLLTAVTEADPDGVATALRELQAANFVLAGSDAATFDFRHALMRDTLYADTDLPHRRRLHGLVAQIAAERGYRDAFISAHYEQAQVPELAYSHAVAAAREAASVSAHREALELYGRALDNLPSHLPAQDRAELYAGLGDEAAATDGNAAAAEAFQTAHDLATGVGDVHGAADLVPRMVEVGHLLGDGLDARIGALQSALGTLDGVAGADRTRGRLYSAMAAAYMLDRRLEEAIEHGERSRAEAEQIGDNETALNVTATLGSAMVFAGRMDEGWRLLEDSVSRARDTQYEAEAARGYRMLGTSASVLVEYQRAERWLIEGMSYAEDVELWNHRHYMAAHLAHVQWATGRWEQAGKTAQRALADGRSGITTRITAQYVLGFLAMGSGDAAAADSFLREALAQGERMAELQRLSPPLWGLAEAARCRDDNETALALCERGYTASADISDASYLWPYLLTGTRASLAQGDIETAETWCRRVTAVLTARGVPGTLPAIGHAQGLILLARGELPEAREALRAASEAWQARNRFWEGSWARLDLAVAAARSRRRGEAARLIADVRADAAPAGASTLVDAADRLGATVGRGRPADPWHPLSAREFEVAKLVATGMTNRQIAEQLILAPKTISAHVEHMLMKLGVGRRTEIAAWVGSVPDIPEE